MGNVAKGTGVVGNRNYIGRTKWAQAKYDFSVLGGVQGPITLTGDTVPNGALILDSWMILDVAPDSAAHTATIAVSIQAANDIVTATIVSNGKWTTVAPSKGLILRSSVPTVLTADRQIVATVATQDLTVGTFRVFVEYVEVAA